MNKVARFFISMVSAFFRAMGYRSCRFHPTCSAYANEAFQTRGFFKASLLTLTRISRCHPFSEGGWDPLKPSHPKAS